MPPAISIQLYTVRDLIAKIGFAAVVKQIADIGYTQVETAGFPGTTPTEAAALFKSLGLKAPSGHFGLPLDDQRQEVIDTAKTIGCRYLVSGKGVADFQTPDRIQQTCDLFNRAAAVANENGLEFTIHNHWWEFEQLDGQPVYQRMLERLQPNVLFEIDTYWVQTGGCDPATVVAELGKRAPLLHIKDGPCEKGQPMLAVGDGKVDFPAIAKASAQSAKFWIVELDACATEMLAAVRKSYQYLTTRGFAKGRK